MVCVTERRELSMIKLSFWLTYSTYNNARGKRKKRTTTKLMFVNYTTHLQLSLRVPGERTPLCVPMGPLWREVPVSTPFYTQVPGTLALCQALQRREIPVPWALRPISVSVTLPLLATGLILSRGHSYKVPWNWKPPLLRKKLCSMQQVLIVTSQKSGQTSIAQWKILHLLCSMKMHVTIFFLPELICNYIYVWKRPNFC